ncbi:M1 family metallopeptidase [Jatrophihabitans sp.]|uniref:M1 family metallopeptidase n=1 Tax=Jatrophihabitans sp. TaxID=1932789 RepID=UPI0030C6E773
MGAASIGDRYLPTSGNGGYRATHYDLELTYRPGANRLDGWARISIVTTQPLRRFTLDLAAGFDVSKVLVGGKAAAKFGLRGGKLQITPARPVDAGAEVVVAVRYSGNPGPVRGTWGEVGWEELTDGALVASQPNGAPSWFPCNDHPSNKATFRTSLAVDSPYHVLCNGTLVSKRAGGSVTTWVYEQDEPMATYLATVQIGHYEQQHLADEPRQLAVLPSRLRTRFTYDFARQPAIMETFGRLFGPYPYAGYTVIVTDDELEIPLEAQGISVFGANHLDGRRGYERLVAHELAHQWFGNSLTVASWQDIWLNEGFACYAEWLWSEESGGDSADAMAARYWKRLAGSPQDLVIADPGPSRMFDDRVYKRGALTLHVLRRALGDEPFFDLLREWTSSYRHGVVSTAGFLDLVSSVDPAAPAAVRPWLFDSKLPTLARARSRR